MKRTTLTGVTLGVFCFGALVPPNVKADPKNLFGDKKILERSEKERTVYLIGFRLPQS